MNKLTILLDFENLDADSYIIEKLYDVSYNHYLGVIERVFIINLNLDILSQEFIGVIKNSAKDDMFVIFDKNYKQNLLQYIRPDQFLTFYCGEKKYCNEYNFSNEEVCFDFKL